MNIQELKLLASGSLRTARRLLSHPAAGSLAVPPLLRFAAWQTLKRVRPRPITVAAFSGVQVRCYPDRTTTNALIYFGLPDWEEMQLLSSLLRPGDGFLDVGANVGLYSLLAWSKVRPNGTIRSFEPEPATAAILRENFALNGLGHETIVEAAVGDAVGGVEFLVGRDAKARAASETDAMTRRVRLVTLDSVVATPSVFTVGKMDIEGYELKAFLGAERLLAAGYPKCWLLETNATCDRYEGSRAELQQLMARHGYELFEVLHAGTTLKAVPMGGPFPTNSLAVRDKGWLVERLPDVRFIS